MDVDFSFAKKRAEKEKQERLQAARQKRDAERRRSEAAAREKQRIDATLEVRRARRRS